MNSTIIILVPVQCFNFNSKCNYYGQQSSPKTWWQTPGRSRRWRSTRRLSTFRLQIIIFPIARAARVQECITGGIIDRKGTCACALRSFGQFPQISPHFGLLEPGNYKPGLSILPCNYAGPGRNCRSWILLLWCTYRCLPLGSRAVITR